MSKRQFERMRQEVIDLFPEFSEAQVTHACNVIGNALRKFDDDMYQVYLGAAPFEAPHIYTRELSVEVSGRTIYISIVVD